jgi:4-amino-4-deoxy-L-arabinose transferase-like glycosyltransferase
MTKRSAVLAAMGLLVVFHFTSLDQVPPIGVLEGWRVDSAYSFYTEGTFTPSMFPGLAEYNHGPFGLGKYKYLLQSFSFHLLDFGVYQARLPLLLGGFLVVYLVYLLGCLLYHEEAALIAAGLFLLSPMFYETHFSGSHAWVAVCLLLAVYFLLRLLSEKRARFSFACGAIVGLSVGFHLTGALGVTVLTLAVVYCLAIREIGVPHVLSYFLGGLVAFGLWCSLEILPIGLEAFLQKATYGITVTQAEAIGKHWIRYFVEGRRGTMIELPLFLVVLGSAGAFWIHNRARVVYLLFLGLVTAYTLFSGSGSLIVVWSVLFVLIGKTIADYVRVPLRDVPKMDKVWIGFLLVLVAYYSIVQVKRCYTTLWVKPGERYEELVDELREYIPEGEMTIGSPLYFFGFAGNNPFITGNFYWERMNAQTNELGDFRNQSFSVNTEKLIRFLRARKVTYLIADEYFKDSLKALIPPTKWEQIFRVEAELSSAIYGGPSTGGQPPYQIQVWRLTSGSEG